MFKPQQPTPPQGGGGENLTKLALSRAIIGRIPGEKQPGMQPTKPSHLTSLTKAPKF